MWTRNVKQLITPTKVAGLVFAMTAIGTAAIAQKIPVFVSVEPQAYVAERVAGDYVNVEALLPAGASPHSYEPKPSQLGRLAEAKVYFKIGLPFETVFQESIESASPPIRIVDMAIVVDRIPIDKEHRHEGEFYDPHVWLSPDNLRRMADAVYQEMVKLKPESRLLMRRNLGTFGEELKLLKQDMDKWFSPYKGRSFFVFHPAYGYFARDTGLNQVAIEHEGKEPSAKNLSELIERARHAEPRSIFVQPQFSSSTASAIAEEIDAEVETLDPLAKDVVENLKEISRKVIESFQPEKE